MKFQQLFLFLALVSAMSLFQACQSEDNAISNNWVSEDGTIRMQFTEDGETFTYTREKMDSEGVPSAESGTYVLSEDNKTLTTTNEMEVETVYEVKKLTADELVLVSDRDGEVLFSVEEE
jgi:hypothetical protein